MENRVAIRLARGLSEDERRDATFACPSRRRRLGALASATAMNGLNTIRKKGMKMMTFKTKRIAMGIRPHQTPGLFMPAIISDGE